MIIIWIEFRLNLDWVQGQNKYEITNPIFYIFFNKKKPGKNAIIIIIILNYFLVKPCKILKGIYVKKINYSSNSKIQYVNFTNLKYFHHF